MHRVLDEGDQILIVVVKRDWVRNRRLVGAQLRRDLVNLALQVQRVLVVKDDAADFDFKEDVEEAVGGEIQFPGYVVLLLDLTEGQGFAGDTQGDVAEHGRTANEVELEDLRFYLVRRARDQRATLNHCGAVKRDREQLIVARKANIDERSRVERVARGGVRVRASDESASRCASRAGQLHIHAWWSDRVPERVELLLD